MTLSEDIKDVSFISIQGIERLQDVKELDLCMHHRHIGWGT